MPSRRELLGAALLMAPGKSTAAEKLKVVVAGAHPDDPETGCGGTIIRYTDAGHADARHPDADPYRRPRGRRQSAAADSAGPVFR